MLMHEKSLHSGLVTPRRAQISTRTVLDYLLPQCWGISGAISGGTPGWSPGGSGAALVLLIVLVVLLRLHTAKGQQTDWRWILCDSGVSDFQQVQHS